jgi:DNA-binding response OmpR family regulator
VKILIADDDELTRMKLETLLSRRGYEVVTAADGHAAWQALAANDRPRLAVIDWLMPGLDGIDLCQRVRADDQLRDLYLLLLTSRGDREHLIAGLRAGANDDVTKPFDPDELQARLSVASQVVRLQAELRGRVRELESALAHVKRLRGLLPICAYCKKIRDDRDYWHEVEQYVAEHTGASFSHGICPACFQKVLNGEDGWGGTSG